MLPLETKQSGGKLLHHLDLRGEGSVSRGGITRQATEKGHCFRYVDLQEVEGGCEEWMELAKDRDMWRALVSTVMNIRVPKIAGNFLTSCRTS